MRRHSGWRRWLAACLLASAVTASSGAADATVAVQLSRSEQVNLSDLVVRATVVGHTYGWNADRTQLVTLTRLRVTEVYKGAAALGVELTLRQFGGEVDGLVSHIAGDPQLQDGADVVAFLRAGPGVVFLTAMAQSVYFVAPPQVSGPASLPGSVTGAGAGADASARVVWRDLSGLSFAVPNARGPMQVVEPVAEGPESLDHLRAALRSLAAGGAR